MIYFSTYFYCLSPPLFHVKEKKLPTTLELNNKIKFEYHNHDLYHSLISGSVPIQT